MDEDTGVKEHHEGHGLVRFVDWLNHKLVGKIGPPDLGPYGEVVRKVGDAVCPVCGEQMAEHTIDRSTPNTVLNCPAPHKPQPAHDEPINEYGMPKHDH
jgi:hypothetical protein